MRTRSGRTPDRPPLSRRERQILDVLYRLESGTVAEVRHLLDDPPSYSAVRAQLRILERKGHVHHREQGPRYVYAPTVSAEEARESAVLHLLGTFFAGSTESAVAALLDVQSGELSAEDYDRLAAMVEQARREGR